MPKESTILLYNSSTTGSAPSAGDLSLGELAVNTMDEKVFLKAFGGSILSLSQTKDLSGNFAKQTDVVSRINAGLLGASFTGPVGISAGAAIKISTTSNPQRITIAGSYTLKGATSGLLVLSDDTLDDFAANNSLRLDYLGDLSFTTPGSIKLGRVAANSGLEFSDGTTQSTAYSAANAVYSFNGATGAVSYALPLASASITGVAHFPNADFAVSATGSVTLSNVARTNAANTFTARQTFSAGLTTANLWVSTGATFGSRSSFTSGITASQLFVSTGATFSGSKIDLIGSNPIIAANNSTGQLTLRADLSTALTPLTANLFLYGADADAVGDPASRIYGSASQVDFNTSGFALTGVAQFNSEITSKVRSRFLGGLTSSELFVSSGATFGSRSSFTSGITSSELFVSSGATFGSRSSFTSGITSADLFVANGATFTGLINDATLKDYGEVYAYQVRKEIGDTKTNNRYYINLEFGNTFFLDLTQSSDNSGTVGGYAAQQSLPAIRLPAYGYATISTTAGLTGATAAFVVGSSTQAVTGAYIFGPGLTEAGVTAMGYNSTSQSLVLSKAALRTVSTTLHAFVRDIPEGYGMVNSPQGSSVSTRSPARIHTFTLIVNSATAGSITWTTGATAYGAIKWPSGTAPTLSTTANKLDVFSFLSTDWGTSWLGFNAGQNF